ncbi:MAG: c-type cytochrome domain-containing protein [Verrucomicrobiota bacterium]
MKHWPFHLTVLAAVVACCSVGLVLMALFATNQTVESLPALFQVAGNMHPLLLHLPIGIFIYLLFAVTLNALSDWNGTAWRIQGIGPMLAFGVVTAYLAAGAGLMLYLQGDYQGELVNNHLWWGLGFALGCGAIALVAVAKGLESTNFLASLYGVGVLLVVTGHYGGLITHGDPLEPLKIEPAAPVKEIPIQRQFVFQDVVAPIIEDKCVYCHSSTGKQKGGLVLDSLEGMIAGGYTGTSLVPGSLEESLLSVYIHLPESDDLHMPPVGKTQLTEEEIQVIDAWVAGGASQEMRIADANLPSDLVEWLVEQSGTELEVVLESPLDSKVIEQIVAFEDRYGKCISRFGPEGRELAFTAVNLRNVLNDDILEEIEVIAPYVVDLDLSQTQISGEALGQLIPNMKRLERLDLSNTAIDDASAVWLRKSPPSSLQSINLYNTELTDKSIESLTRLGGLQSIYLSGTQISSEGVEQLKQSLPDAKIFYELAAIDPVNEKK